MYKLEWNPEIYSQCSDLQYTTAIKWLDRLELTGKENILDIGCGDGKITDYLANITQEKVLGIDNSRAMITFAKKNHRKENLRFEIIDVQTLNLEEKFDLVTSFFCLSWVLNKELAFKNIKKLLKKNGKLLVISALFSASHIELLAKLIKKPHWENYFRDYQFPFNILNDIEYKKYADLARIHVDSIKIETVKHSFPNRSALKDFFMALIPHVNHLSETTQKDAFINEVMDSYLKNSTDYSLTLEIVRLVGKNYLNLTDEKTSISFFNQNNPSNADSREDERQYRAQGHYSV